MDNNTTQFKLNFNGDPAHAANMNSESCAFVPSQVRSGHFLLNIQKVEKYLSRKNEELLSVPPVWKVGSVPFASVLAQLASQSARYVQKCKLRASKDILARKSLLWIPDLTESANPRSRWKVQIDQKINKMNFYVI
jgi:hypothetical protein